MPLSLWEGDIIAMAFCVAMEGVGDDKIGGTKRVAWEWHECVLERVC